MGDHRASIKIEMSFHGIEDKADMWINYCDSDGNGLDQRVIDFFSRIYERGMNKYNEEMVEYYAECDARERENRERNELARLKKIYE